VSTLLLSGVPLSVARRRHVQCMAEKYALCASRR